VRVFHEKKWSRRQAATCLDAMELERYKYGKTTSFLHEGNKENSMIPIISGRCQRGRALVVKGNDFHAIAEKEKEPTISKNRRPVQEKETCMIRVIGESNRHA
jgi:hypothetical protein